MTTTDKQTEFLQAHLDDLFQSAQSGVFRASEFFTPSQLVSVRRYLSRRDISARTVIYGGYEYAERARVYFLCDYMLSEEETSLADTLSFYGYDDPTVILKIDGSGFRSLSHRDFLGSILSLGIERDVIGDIVVCGDSCAYVFCDGAIADFIIENLKKVARDGVKVSRSSLPEGDFGVRRYREIRDTVASLRLDCILASALNMSRENAKRTVNSGICEVNYESEDAPDREMCVGDVFSIRGYGKFRLASLGGENARGRLRIVIHKYE